VEAQVVRHITTAERPLDLMAVLVVGKQVGVVRPALVQMEPRRLNHKRHPSLQLAENNLDLVVQ
jgi:hypothetical protein